MLREESPPYRGNGNGKAKGLNVLDRLPERVDSASVLNLPVAGP